MKVMNKVRGTQTSVLSTEVNVDTVYVRSNITRIETEEFVGWEYDEEQWDKNEYIAQITEESKALKIAQAETNTNLLELMEFILLGGM